jgi:protein-disulfide isomerase
VAAIAIVGILVHREFFQRANGQPSRQPEYVANWREAIPASRLVHGDPNARVMIVEFTDFECPICKRFQTLLNRVDSIYPSGVSHSFVHFPLSIHAHALGAARAAECANNVGRFASAVNLIFSNQESVAKGQWSFFPSGLGLADDPQFGRCLADTVTPPFVRQGLDVGVKMKVAGTPTVLLNGWRYPGMPSDTEFVRAVGDLLAGRKPYREFPAKAINAAQQ